MCVTISRPLDRFVYRYMKEKFCVTGCYGAVGSTICNRLLADDAFVVGIDKVDRDTIQHKNFVRVIDDLSCYSKLFFLLKSNGINAIIHTAANLDTSLLRDNYEELYADNCESTKLLIMAAHAANVKVFVYTSTHNIDFEMPTFPQKKGLWVSNYTWTKYNAEQEVNSFGRVLSIKTVSLRAGIIFGENDRYFPKLIKASKLGARFAPTNDVWWDAVSLEELAAMHIHVARMMLSGSKKANVLSGNTYHVGYKRKALSDWNNLLVGKGLEPMDIQVPWFFWLLIGILCECCEYLCNLFGSSIRHVWIYWTIADARKMYTSHFYSNERFLKDFEWGNYRPELSLKSSRNHKGVPS